MCKKLLLYFRIQVRVNLSMPPMLTEMDWSVNRQNNSPLACRNSLGSLLMKTCFLIMSLCYSFCSEGILHPSRYTSSSASTGSVATYCWRVRFHSTVVMGVLERTPTSEMTLAENRKHGYMIERKGAVTWAQLRKNRENDRRRKKMAIQAPIAMDWELIPDPTPFPPPPPAPKKS